MAHEPLILGVSEFVAYTNQTLEYAYPSVVIEGELANFKISKGKWVYFDLKDTDASVRFFGTVYMLKHQLEDGMLLRVRGVPRLHPQFGFSLTIQDIALVGEGTIKQAAKLLEEKLAKEGLFEESRKRSLPYPPQHIGLITSTESAAYADFTKIIAARWPALRVTCANVQVQGVSAPEQVIRAITAFNQLPQPPEVLVIIRGGGSAEDLQAFNDETLVRSVAASRIPVLAAIGHEIDVALVERAADKRASTPSNAAELLVPDKQAEHTRFYASAQSLNHSLQRVFQEHAEELQSAQAALTQNVRQRIVQEKKLLGQKQDILAALDPEAALRRGYAIIRKGQEVIRSSTQLKRGDIVELGLQDATATAQIQDITNKEFKKKRNYA